LTINITLVLVDELMAYEALDCWCKSHRCQLLYQRLATQRLPSKAEVGATVLHQDSLDGAAANKTGFASLMSNLKIEMRCAQLALGADVAIHAGALLIQMLIRT
jgi:hypothetical protein